MDAYDELPLKAAANGWRSLRPSEQEALRRWMSANTDRGHTVSMLKSLMENEDARAHYVDHDTGWRVTGPSRLRLTQLRESTIKLQQYFLGGVFGDR